MHIRSVCFQARPSRLCRGARAFCPQATAFCRRNFWLFASRLVRPPGLVSILFLKQAVRQHAGHSGQNTRAPQALTYIVAALASVLPAAQGQDDHETSAQSETAQVDPVVVSATRTDIPLDRSPASVSEIGAEEIEIKQTQRVSDALREVPGLSVVQTGTAGQLTSVFMRGLPSEDLQVLFDGIPINQGLSGAMNFADLTVDNISRIEVARGPQSTIYGPRALSGAIQIFSNPGQGPPGVTLTAEGGSYQTGRETLQSSGGAAGFDYSVGASRIDTENARPNNDYRNSAVLADVGWSPVSELRIGTVLTYSLSDAGDPNTTSDPHLFDRLLTERWLVAPHIDLHIADWWDHRLIFDYDHERQVNNPNVDGFVGPTRALFERTQIDYQNNLRPTSWLTLTSGLFYSAVDLGQERPFVVFGPTFIHDQTEDDAAFLQAALDIYDFLLVVGGRLDQFNEFGDVWTYRVAGSYKIDKTNSTLHGSAATGFSPPSSQDKIFGNNFDLNPEKDFGWEIGLEQRLYGNRVAFDATYFHNDLSNVIGFNGRFKTFNLGEAETQGVETELRAQPITDVTLRASYTYLDARKTSAADVSQPLGARLPRRPRNEVYVSASYLWCKKLRTTIEAKWVNAREELNFGQPNFDIEDYNFVNFLAEYQINAHLSIYGRVDNLTNEHYSEVFGFPALGRVAYGGIKMRF
jgi:vitamin B12 transporter